MHLCSSPLPTEQTPSPLVCALGPLCPLRWPYLPLSLNVGDVGTPAASVCHLCPLLSSVSSAQKSSLPEVLRGAASSTKPSSPSLPASNVFSFPSTSCLGAGLVSACGLVIDGLVSAPPSHCGLLGASFTTQPRRPPAHSTPHPGRAHCLLV